MIAQHIQSRSFFVLEWLLEKFGERTTLTIIIVLFTVFLLIYFLLGKYRKLWLYDEILAWCHKTLIKTKKLPMPPPEDTPPPPDDRIERVAGAVLLFLLLVIILAVFLYLYYFVAKH